MAVQNGTQFLLALSNEDANPGPETFTVVGGFTSNGVTRTAETADAMTKADAGQQKFVGAAGKLSTTFSGSGLLEDKDSFATIDGLLNTRTSKNMQMTVPGLGTYIGFFRVTSLELTGEQEAGISCSITCESDGPVNFVVEA